MNIQQEQSYWFHAFVGFFVFAIINAPSLKLIYISEFINIIAVMCLWGLGFLKLFVFSNGRIYLGPAKFAFIALFTIFWVILLFYGALGPYSMVSLKLLAKYLGVYLAVVGITLFITSPKEIYTVLTLQVLWAIGLAAVQTLGGGIDFGRAQHYLTLGVPLASGLVTLFGLTIIVKNLWLKLAGIPLAVMIVLALTTLIGRAPVLFSSTTILVFWVLVILFNGSIKQKIRQLLLLVSSGAVVLLVIMHNLSDHWLSRFEGLEKVEEEPRMRIYDRAFELITSNPYGYGLNASDLLIGIYPHNIFLESLISAGFGSLLALSILLVLFAVVVFRSLRLQSYLLPCCMLSIYLLLTWNVSFGLANAFTPIGAMAVSIVAYDLLSRRSLTSSAERMS